MAEVQDPNGIEQGEPKIKVTDRRRFREDGEPVDAREDTGGSETQGQAFDHGQESTGLDQERDRKLIEQEAQIDELKRAYAALLEDNKAFRARLEREKERALAAERARIVQALFESADELERAMAAATSMNELPPLESLAALREGVGLTLASLAKRISDLGAERLSVVGERFDPHVAEAIDVIPVADEAQDERVVQEVRAGYRMGESVLRPARVRVGRLVRA
jgi:molecular chaperone GrpE